MKRLLLAGCPLALMLALGWTTSALAQASNAAPQGSAARTEEYCQVSATPKLNGRYLVSIDFGQKQKLVSLNLFRDATGKAVEFNSAIDALNWLNAQGWELVSTFVLVEGGSVAYYVLRRRLPS